MISVVFVLGFLTPWTTYVLPDSILSETVAMLFLLVVVVSISIVVSVEPIGFFSSTGSR